MLGGSTLDGYYVLYISLMSLTSGRLKFLLTIAITRRAVAAALMNC